MRLHRPVLRDLPLVIEPRPTISRVEHQQAGTGEHQEGILAEEVVHLRRPIRILGAGDGPAEFAGSALECEQSLHPGTAGINHDQRPHHQGRGGKSPQRHLDTGNLGQLFLPYDFTRDRVEPQQCPGAAVSRVASIVSSALGFQRG